MQTAGTMDACTFVLLHDLACERFRQKNHCYKLNALHLISPKIAHVLQVTVHSFGGIAIVTIQSNIKMCVLLRLRLLLYQLVYIVSRAFHLKFTSASYCFQQLKSKRTDRLRGWEINSSRKVRGYVQFFLHIVNTVCWLYVYLSTTCDGLMIYLRTCIFHFRCNCGASAIEKANSEWVKLFCARRLFESRHWNLIKDNANKTPLSDSNWYLSGRCVFYERNTAVCCIFRSVGWIVTNVTVYLRFWKRLKVEPPSHLM